MFTSAHLGKVQRTNCIIHYSSNAAPTSNEEQLYTELKGNFSNEQLSLQLYHSNIHVGVFKIGKLTKSKFDRMKMKWWFRLLNNK